MASVSPTTVCWRSRRRRSTERAFATCARWSRVCCTNWSISSNLTTAPRGENFGSSHVLAAAPQKLYCREVFASLPNKSNLTHGRKTERPQSRHTGDTPDRLQAYRRGAPCPQRRSPLRYFDTHSTQGDQEGARGL